MAIFLNSKSTCNTLNNLKFWLVEPSRVGFCRLIRIICLCWIDKGFRALAERPPQINRPYCNNAWYKYIMLDILFEQHVLVLPLVIYKS